MGYSVGASEAGTNASLWPLFSTFGTFAIDLIRIEETQDIDIIVLTTTRYSGYEMDISIYTLDIVCDYLTNPSCLVCSFAVFTTRSNFSMIPLMASRLCSS